MTPYALQCVDKTFALAALTDRERVVQYLKYLPEAPYRPEMEGKPLSGLGRKPKDDADALFGYGKPQWSCHALVRAALRHAGLSLAWRTMDGWYASIGQQHSWLLFDPSAEERQKRLILDVYPIAHLTEALLVDASYGSPSNRLYIAPSYTLAELATFEEEAQIASQLHPLHQKT